MDHNTLSKVIRINRQGGVGISGSVEMSFVTEKIEDSILIVGWNKSGQKVVIFDLGYPVASTILGAYESGNVALFLKMAHLLNADKEIKANLSKFLTSLKSVQSPPVLVTG